MFLEHISLEGLMPRESEPETGRLGRRRLIAATLTGIGGGAVAGLAGGMALAAAPRGPIVEIKDRQRFRDKVVLITGATSGIGAAAARMFAAEGGKVGFCGRRVDRGRLVEGEIRARGGVARYIRADVRVEDDVRRFVDNVAEEFGGLDVCFNNAGITLEKPLHEYSLAEWDDVVNTDLRGVFLALKYEIPHLIARGGGVVVVTSSSNAIATGPNKSAYSAAKRGLVGLVQAAAQDYAEHNIRINALIPGTTDTELVRRVAGMLDAPDAVWETAAAIWARSHIPAAHRMAKPEEIAAFALTLASDEFPYMNGAQMVIDGGKTAYGGRSRGAVAIPAGSRNRQPANPSRMEYAGTAWV
jgi:NAD(P)-dependent dehydrogenase (short-subunit alcohol dehydrogenase family)